MALLRRFDFLQWTKISINESPIGSRASETLPTIMGLKAVYIKGLSLRE